MYNVNQKKVTAENIVFGNYTVYNSEDYKSKYEKLLQYLRSNNFFKLTQFINTIDKKILSSIRELTSKTVSSSSISFHYNNAIFNTSRDFDINLYLLLDILNNNEIIIDYEISSDIQVLIDSNLENIRFSRNDLEILLENPTLLWECNKVINGFCEYKNCALHQNFNSQEEADNFSEIFKKGVIEIEFDNTKTYWKQYPDLWPASIDTFNMILDIKKLGYHKKFFNSVIDIGTGTGFLGLWFANNNISVKNLLLTDWLLLPLIVSSINSPKTNRRYKIDYAIGLNTTLTNTVDIPDIVDLAICNPPYIPSIGFENLLKESTVAGTELLEHIIKNHKSIANETIISFSNLALPEALNAANEVGIDLMQKKVLQSHEVPFRVRVAFDEPGYIDKLIDEGRELIVKENNSFRYWHKISTYILNKI